VVLIGSANLTRRYGQAITQQGGGSRALGSEATWAGLTALAEVISKE
jgi:2-dehydro-3-deoxygalactonokinase